MTIEEAIDIIRKSYLVDANGDTDRNRIKANWMAVEALKKQIPQKPRKIKVEYANCDSVWYPTFCPRCFDNANIGLWDRLIDKETPYCRRCGQAIDWSEE